MSSRLKMKSEIQWIMQQWQEVMKLQDWHIEVEMLSRAAFDQKHKINELAYGRNTFYRYYRTSYITVCNDAPNPEYTLVHELVHLLVDPLDSTLDQSITMAPGEPAQQLLKGSQIQALECVVNHLTQAFLKTRRFAYEQGGYDNNNN